MGAGKSDVDTVSHENSDFILSIGTSVHARIFYSLTHTNDVA